MTDEEYSVLERITAWHVLDCAHDRRSIDYGAVANALRLLKRERGDRAVTAAIAPLVEDPDLIRRSDWREESSRRVSEALAAAFPTPK